MIPYTADAELRKVFKELSRVGFKSSLRCYFMSDLSNTSLIVPSSFVVRFEDKRDQGSTFIYDYLAKKIPLRCHGLPILDVEIFRNGREVYYERRSNGHQDRPA